MEWKNIKEWEVYDYEKDVLFLMKNGTIKFSQNRHGYTPHPKNAIKFMIVETPQIDPTTVLINGGYLTAYIDGYSISQILRVNEDGDIEDSYHNTHYLFGDEPDIKKIVDINDNPVCMTQLRKFCAKLKKAKADQELKDIRPYLLSFAPLPMAV